MNSTTGKRRSALAHAAATARRVQIEDLRLLSCKCHQTSSVLLGNQGVQYSTSASYRVNGLTIEVKPKFTLEARPSDEAAANAKPSLVIEATYGLRYRASNLDGLSADNIKHFAELNGIYNAWPYWREFVQSMVSRMGLPPLIVPLFLPEG